MSSNRKTSLAAVRHIVFRDVLDYLPVASYDQAQKFVVNLAAARADIGSNARSVLVPFLNMRVTPDIAEAGYRGATLKEIELWLNRKYGERLSHVAGFYRRNETAPFRLNLPSGSAMFGYRSEAGFYSGILCQPLDRHNFYFLLSSRKFDGPKAIQLTPRDQQYFSQFKEVSI